MKHSILCGLLAGVALIPAGTFAQSVPLTQDAYVTQGAAQNFGAATTLNVDGASGSRALVQFDLSALPAGLSSSSIAKATLTLFSTKVTTPGNVNVSVANGTWTEASVDGTIAPVAAASVATGVAVSAANRFISVDATTAVQSWFNGVTNNGFIIEPASNVSVQFDSKESTTTSHAATLTLFLFLGSPSSSTVSSLSPSSAMAGSASFTLTVTGSGFVAGSTVNWNGSTTAPLATTFVNSTRLTAIVPASLVAKAGPASVGVQNPGVTQSNTSVFTVTGPIVTSLSPASVVAGSPALSLSVTGSGFVADSSVKWTSGATTLALATTFVSSTQLTATVPATAIATTGSATVSVQTSGAAQSNAVVFTVTPPTLVSLSPATTPAGSAPLPITVTGTGFVAGAAVSWKGATNPVLLPTTFVSGAQLTATVPGTLMAKAGSVTLGVQNPGGALSNTATFTIGPAVPTTPVLSSLSPASTAAGSKNLTLTIRGTGFLADSLIIWTNGSTYRLSTTVLSSTEMTALLPSALIANPGNSVTITVQNPGPLNSAAVGFVVR